MHIRCQKGSGTKMYKYLVGISYDDFSKFLKVFSVLFGIPVLCQWWDYLSGADMSYPTQKRLDQAMSNKNRQTQSTDRCTYTVRTTTLLKNFIKWIPSKILISLYLIDWNLA